MARSWCTMISLLFAPPRVRRRTQPPVHQLLCCGVVHRIPYAFWYPHVCCTMYICMVFDTSYKAAYAFRTQFAGSFQASRVLVEPATSRIPRLGQRLRCAAGWHKFRSMIGSQILILAAWSHINSLLEPYQIANRDRQSMTSTGG